MAVGVGLDDRRQEHLVRQMVPGRHEIVEHGAKIDLGPGPQRGFNLHIYVYASCQRFSYCITICPGRQGAAGGRKEYIPGEGDQLS